MALNLDTLGLSATVTAQGISAPDYQTILDTLTSYFRQIYGSDAYLEPDSQKMGKWSRWWLWLCMMLTIPLSNVQLFSPDDSAGRSA